MYDALNFEKVCQKKRECTLKQTLTTDTHVYIHNAYSTHIQHLPSTHIQHSPSTHIQHSPSTHI